MKKHDYTLKIALYMFLSIAGFFFLLKLLGLEHITELRFLNILIIGYFSNRLAKNVVQDQNEISYLGGISSIFLANIINVVLSVVGLVIYVSVIDTNFMSNFSNTLMFGENISLSQMGLAIFMEGMAGSAIISFTVMQYWKDVKRSTKKIDVKEFIS